jgi:hypothetical protein
MSRIDIVVADDLAAWARERAEAEKPSLDTTIEVLIGLESGLRERAHDGRAIRSRTRVYRGETQILAGEPAAAA